MPLPGTNKQNRLSSILTRENVFKVEEHEPMKTVKQLTTGESLTNTLGGWMEAGATRFYSLNIRLAHKGVENP